MQQLLCILAFFLASCNACQKANFNFGSFAAQRKGFILDTLHLDPDGGASQIENTYMVDPATGTFSPSLGNWYTHSCDGDYIKFVGVGTSASGNPSNVTNFERLEIVMRVASDDVLIVVNSTVFEIPFGENIFKSRSSPERLESNYAYVRVPDTPDDDHSDHELIYSKRTYSGSRV